MKQFGQFLLLAILISMMGGKAFAHDIEAKNADGIMIYYNWINNNTELEVSFRSNSYESFYKYRGNVVIPKSVTYNGVTYNVTAIGMYAFENCTGLTSVTIPNSVIYISHAFRNCSALVSINVEESNSVYDSRNNCNAVIRTADNELIIGCQNTLIPNSVISIGSYAFDGCSGLTSLTIPNNVTSIGSSAFYGCSGLTSVTIPNSVTSIGSSAFAGCSSLTSVTIPHGVTSIDNYTFSRCTSLNSVTIPNSVTSIRNNAFFDSSGLTSIKVEEGNSVYDSRNRCNAIIKTADNELVIGCKNTIIPNSVTSIDKYAFRNCSGLTYVAIPKSVTTINKYAFHGCSGLISIKVEEGNSVYDSRGNCNAIIITADNELFLGCKNTMIPNDVTSISERAFYGCSDLTSITIPNSVTSIGMNAFFMCSDLVSINVEEGNPVFDSRNNCNAIIKKTDNELILGCQNSIIPNSVTSISSLAFANCSGLTFIIIPNSVTSVNADAFYGCSGLTSVIIPNSVTFIGSGAFKDCSGLASVTIGKSVTYIGDNAFSGCSNLTSVSINKETPIEIHSDIFSNRINATLYVPIGSKASYETADYWKDFKEIVEIDMDMPAVNYVDLGLPSGLLWATCNLGADRPEQFGNYYDWVNNPVQESWDNVWRTPTKAERDELVQYCTYSLETINGVQGAKYTGSNGQSIFFPFAGYYQSGYGPYKVGVGGQYWTTTEYSSNEHWIIATNNPIQADDNGYYWPLNYFGFPVRPVTSVRPNIIGDANGDGNVDNSDINAIVEYLMNGKSDGFNFNNADTNNDQKVNAADIVKIVNMIKK